MRNSETREIDGTTFVASQMDAKKAFLMSRRLAAVLAPALARAGGAAASGLANLDVASLAGAVDVLFERLSEAEFSKLSDELFACVEVEREGKRGPLLKVFDSVLAGNVLTAYKVLAFSLEVNFLPFGQGLAGLLRTMQAAAPGRLSAPPQTSPGPSGG